MSGNEERPIALIGLRGAGKSSLGQRLATKLGRGFLDLDEELVRFAAGIGHECTSAGELLRRLGEPGFRAVEAASLRAVLAAAVPAPAPVLATGGGVVERPENRFLLRERTLCVWLRVKPAVAARRVAADVADRPALLGLDHEAEAVALAERREPLYTETAHLKLDCDELGIEELARALASLVEAAHS